MTTPLNTYQRNRVQITFTRKTITKQSHQHQCDINKIMAKYQKTGAIEHTARHAPQYANSIGIDFLEAQRLVATTNSMFEDLPATVRAHFNNKPDEFLDFVQEPENEAELRKLGLWHENPPAQPETTTEPSTAPEPSGTAAETPPAETPPGQPPGGQPATP